MADNVCALDLSQQYTRIAHLEVKKDKIELLSLGYENTTPNFFTSPDERTAQEQAKIIRALFTQLNMSSRNAHVVIPDSLCFSQLLLMPDLPEAELVKAIKLQADELVPLPISEVYLDLEIINKLPNGKILLLFIASPKRVVDHIHSTIQFADLEPVTLENELSATGRFLSEFFKGVKEPTLFVNFGFAGSSLYVMNPPFPYFQLTRSSRIGYDILLRDLQVNSNLGATKSAEALRTIGLSTQGSVNVYPIIYPILNELFSEIEKTSLLVQEKYHVALKKIYFFNYNAHVGYLHETVQNRLMIPTQSFPLSSLLLPNTITQTFSQLLSTFVPVIATHIR